MKWEEPGADGGGGVGGDVYGEGGDVGEYLQRETTKGQESGRFKSEPSRKVDGY
jgi:hypothetical protein